VYFFAFAQNPGPKLCHVADRACSLGKPNLADHAGKLNSKEGKNETNDDLMGTLALDARFEVAAFPCQLRNGVAIAAIMSTDRPAVAH
jgi:hypothetical protein